jgi:hypothetical protein
MKEVHNVLSKELDCRDRCDFGLAYVCSGCPGGARRNRRHGLPLKHYYYRAGHLGEIFVGSFEGKGINRITSEPSRDVSFHQVGTLKGQGGKWSWNGFSKALHPNGDFVIWEFSGDSAIGVSTSKAIYGTGKYKGVKGEIKLTQITKAKPIVDGTMQECQKFVGWMEY